MSSLRQSKMGAETRLIKTDILGVETEIRAVRYFSPRVKGGNAPIVSIQPMTAMSRLC